MSVARQLTTGSPPRRGDWRGFTLIELLLVVLLLGTVMTVIMASFEGGFRVYERVSAFGTGEMEAYLAGEIIERDLKNSIHAEDAPFTGEPDAMEMLAVVYAGEPGGQIRRVRYQVAETGLQRLTAMPAGAGTSAAQDAATATDLLLRGAYVLKLRYQGPPAAGGGSGGTAGGWSDTWAGSSNLPVAVQIEIAGGALAEGPIVRTVMLGTAEGGEQP